VNGATVTTDSVAAGPEAPQQFPPTLREVMIRPTWIGMLVLCLIVAGVFAWLGQWQLSNAIDTDVPPPGATEQVKPIESIVEPGEYLQEPVVGQKVEATGSFVAEDFIVISSRFNDGEPGYWVSGQFRMADTEEPTSLAVALGWTQTREEADAAVAKLQAAVKAEPEASFTLTGRIISDEGATLPGRGAGAFDVPRMSPAALLSFWHDTENLNVYRPYMTSATVPFEGTGLTDIISPPPAEPESVNWLNVFYAIEWAVFAGFAFYLWYRLARDARERELEEFEDARAEALAARG